MVICAITVQAVAVLAAEKHVIMPYVGLAKDSNRKMTVNHISLTGNTNGITGSKHERDYSELLEKTIIVPNRGRLIPYHLLQCDT